MKKIISLFSLLLFVGLVFTSCKKDEPTVINATDFVGTFEYTVYSKWANGSTIGTVDATTNKGNMNYTLVSQNITGAIAINATTGQITLADKSALNKSSICKGKDGRLTSVVKITNGSVTRDINVTITLTEWCNR